MDSLMVASALVTTASLAAWVWLVAARGQFWRTDQRLCPESQAGEKPQEWPAVSIVVPARNEAHVLPQSLPSLLSQQYSGSLRVFLVDDHSEDGTAEVARRTAMACARENRLTARNSEPLPQGWTGKLWALHQGVRAGTGTEAEFLLLTDADIAHPPDNVRDLVIKAQRDRLDLVSLMARLRVETLWERLLIPAFVYFFARLYPFRWASDPRHATAAAAGGCVLVRREALERSGELEPISGELIDDCALAKRIKMRGSQNGGRTWLGLSQEIRSAREYVSLAPVWDTVSRTAFAQLKFSSVLLVGTAVGMLFLYLTTPLAALGGLAAIPLGDGGSGAGRLGTGGLGRDGGQLRSHAEVAWDLGAFRTPIAADGHAVYPDDRGLCVAVVERERRSLEGQDLLVLGCRDNTTYPTHPPYWVPGTPRTPPMGCNPIGTPELRAGYRSLFHQENTYC